MDHQSNKQKTFWKEKNDAQNIRIIKYVLRGGPIPASTSNYHLLYHVNLILLSADAAFFSLSV
jgi:hypothetical protein